MVKTLNAQLASVCNHVYIKVCWHRINLKHLYYPLLGICSSKSCRRRDDVANLPTILSRHFTQTLTSLLLFFSGSRYTTSTFPESPQNFDSSFSKISSNMSWKGSVEEQDAAEVKKAIAMGQEKEPSASPGTTFLFFC